jgi:hypothetical protein
LLLVGSCLNPQPDSFPQADDEHGARQNNPLDANGTTAVVDQPPQRRCERHAGALRQRSRAQAQAPLAPMSPPAAAQPQGGDFDAGRSPPDAGRPDANFPANNAF